MQTKEENGHSQVSDEAQYKVLNKKRKNEQQ